MDPRKVNRAGSTEANERREFSRNESETVSDPNTASVGDITLNETRDRLDINMESPVLLTRRKNDRQLSLPKVTYSKKQRVSGRFVARAGKVTNSSQVNDIIITNSGEHDSGLSPSHVLCSHGQTEEFYAKQSCTPMIDQVVDEEVPISSLRNMRKVKSSNRNSENGNRNLLNRVNKKVVLQRADITEDVAGNIDELQAAYNEIKAVVRELKHEKRVYVSAYNSLMDTKKSLEKELQAKQHHIIVLEDTLQSRKQKRNGTDSTWNTESLKSCGLEDYQAIFVLLEKYARRQADLIVRELFIDMHDDDKRKHDWRGSAVEVSDETAFKSVVFVRLPGGAAAIPTCVVERAMKAKMYTNRFASIKGVLQEGLETILKGPLGKFMNDDERIQCMNKISAHTGTVQKFRTIIAAKDSSRKRTSKDMYLQSLGYNLAGSAQSRKDSEELKAARQQEKRIVREKCAVDTRNGNPSTTYWRLCEWKDICMDAVDAKLCRMMADEEFEYSKDGVVDNLFMNHAARTAFIELLGQKTDSVIDDFGNDVSIITLARADACITNSIRNIMLPGKGGTKNATYKESFKKLFILAMDRIISQLWRDLADLDSGEFSLRIGNSAQTSEDPYGNQLRNWTAVFLNPVDNYLYLVVTPRYFRERICSWMGNVKDAQIGRCKSTDERFEKLSSAMKFDILEDSDLDDIEDEN